LVSPFGLTKTQILSFQLSKLFTQDLHPSPKLNLDRN
jgi:hypothetical protein